MYRRRRATNERVMRALGKDLPVPTAVGLERNGEVLIKPYSPPYYHNMEEAVLAFVDYKYERARARSVTVALPRAGEKGRGCSRHPALLR